MGMREKMIEVLMSRQYGFCSYDQMADYLLSKDVVPVVRCKNCLYYQETIGKDSGKPCGYGSCYCKSAVITGIVYDEDFCSYGERKDNDI